MTQSLTIYVEGGTSRIEGKLTREMLDAITEVTAYYRKGYQFSNRFRSGVWDGRIRLFKNYGKSFPSGLLNDVVDALKDAGARVRVDDQRHMPPLPPVPPPEECGLDGVGFDYPYDYQPEVMEKAINARRGVLHMATNCLSGDTIVEVHRAGRSFKSTLKRLYLKENRIGTRKWELGIPTKIRSATSEGYIRLNRILQVVESGTKKLFCLTTKSGKAVRASGDHKFLTPSGWVRLKNLKVGSTVLVDVGRIPVKTYKVRRYKFVGGMDYHPYASIHRDKRSGRRNYFSVRKHRVVYEAYINGLSFSEFVDRVRRGDLSGLRFIDPKVYCVHHKNGNVCDNSLDNLDLLTTKEHFKHHSKTDWKNVTARVGEDQVVSIARCGAELTYDISVEGDHNFLANGIVVHNSGKTEVACLIAQCLRLPTLFLVPGKDLLYQSADRFMKRLGLDNREVGMIGDGRWQVGDWITVATVPSLHANLKKLKCQELLDQTQLIFADECFPAGTMVGDKPIEEINVGDFVPSFEAATGQIIQKKVTWKYINSPQAMLRVRLADRELCCTRGHPFLTQRGWIEAWQLKKTDTVLCSVQEQELGNESKVHTLRKEDRKNPRSRECGLRGVQDISQKDSKDALHRVRSNMRARGGSGAQASQEGKGLLLGGLQEEMDVPQSFRSCYQEKLEGQRKDFQAHEGKQPDGKPQSASKAESYAQGHGLEASSAWWEWDGTDGSRTVVGQHVGVARGYDQDRQEEGIGLSDQLQGGSGQRRTEDRYRGGWGLPLHDRETAARSKEGKALAWIRVDGVEVLEQTSDGTFGGVCPDGLVYNLEVEDTHTYVARGAVVHNCHSVGSDSWFEVVKACNAYFRFGMSGTPLSRTDGADLRLVSVTGPVITQVRNKFLIERGISCEVEVWMLPVRKPESIHPKTPYNDAYDMGIVENIWRNRAIAMINSHIAKQGLQSAVLVRKIDHGKELDKRLWTVPNRDFVPHQFICGKEPTAVRQQALRDFKRGDLQSVISTKILNQGIDVPCIDVLFVAGGGESSIETLQRVGRGLRTGGNSNKLIVVDFADFTNKHLLKHSLQRYRDYKAEDCFHIKEINLRDFC